VHLLDGRVVPVGGDQSRTLLARVVDAVEVTRQRRTLVGDLDGFYRRVEERGASPERGGLFVERLDEARVQRCTVEKRVGGPVVVRGAQVGFACADLVAFRLARLGDLIDAVGRLVPLSAPAVGTSCRPRLSRPVPRWSYIRRSRRRRIWRGQGPGLSIRRPSLCRTRFLRLLPSFERRSDSIKHTRRPLSALRVCNLPRTRVHKGIMKRPRLLFPHTP
jgi:hypothetical protein